LASIRGAGGIGSLKRVDKAALDKPNVILQEARGEAPPPPPAGGAGNVNLADALAQALHSRKAKVGGSDDEDAEDDW
jgi:neural Wiskott-Aldrich syndrome protein